MRHLVVIVIVVLTVGFLVFLSPYGLIKLVLDRSRSDNGRPAFEEAVKNMDEWIKESM